MGIHPNTIRLLLELEIKDRQNLQERRREVEERIKKEPGKHEWELDELDEIEDLTNEKIRKIQSGNI